MERRDSYTRVTMHGLSGEIMPDYLHLSAKGYDIWGKAIKGDLEKLVK